MSGSGKGLLGLWLYRSGESEWAVKEGSPLHKEDELLVNIVLMVSKLQQFMPVIHPPIATPFLPHNHGSCIKTETIYCAFIFFICS